MTSTLILVRHAAHVHLDATLSGRMSSVPLSKSGRAEARRLAARLAGRGLDAVRASPLERAWDTALAIADAAGLEAETAEGLQEIDFGEWTGRRFDELADDPAWNRWNGERASARPPGGESMAEAQARIVACLDATAREHDGGTVVLVSHADMIRAAVAHVLGLPLDNLLRFDIDPASATTVTWSDWGARVARLNERED